MKFPLVPFFRVFAAVLPCAVPLSAAGATDWPFYRGPSGNGVTAAALGKPWDASGPKAVWKTEVTGGFSSIAVADGVAATLMTREFEGTDMEFCVAMDPATGKELWATPLKMAKYQKGGESGTPDNKGGDGPRGTPAIAGGRVYAYGANLDLYCFDAKTGEKLWEKDVAREFKGKNISWQNAISPLVLDGMVIVAGGGKGAAFLAFDAKSGALKWKGENDTITHATPVPAEIHGVKQVVFFTKEGLVSVAPADGKVLWRQPFKFNVSTAASPVVWEDVVYCSAGYGVGSAAYRVVKKGSEFELEELWRKEGEEVCNHWSTPVVKDGFLYGMFSFKQYGNGPVKCVDIRTGEVKWSREGFGPGNVILAKDNILALSDKGELVIIEPSPDGYKELARADVLDGKCWSTPVLANGRIFARSTREAGCFSIIP